MNEFRDLTADDLKTLPLWLRVAYQLHDFNWHGATSFKDVKEWARWAGVVSPLPSKDDDDLSDVQSAFIWEARHEDLMRFTLQECQWAVEAAQPTTPPTRES